MITKKVTVKNSQGFHMRPANEFASKMSRFEAEINIIFGDDKINGKSLMNIMAAGIRQGSELTIECDGHDENEMLDAAVQMIEDGFGEV